MACQGSYVWSLSGVVTAFVDLAIAYFLLCAATVAFLASKFLGFLGLRLPCPCHGLFGTVPNGNLCLHRLLIDFPAERVSNVHLSIRTNFPFNDTTVRKDQNCNLSWSLINSAPQGYLEMGDEASCSSISDETKPHNHIARIELSPRNEFGDVNSPSVSGGKLGIKGKAVMNQKQRGGFRRRRRRKSDVDHGRSSSVSLYDPQYEEFPVGPASPPSINKEDDGHPSTVMRLGRRESFELNGFSDEFEQHIGKNFASIEELRHDGESDSSFHEKHRIRVLERALEHEQEARAALYLELEKERNAAATAADEAMAMILRLQEEKASIEMEARQYQRIIEEKSAYEAEEMDILKEILVRTEREKHFLEKELEVYRQMTYLGNEESAVDSGNAVHILRRGDGSSDPNEDPVLMLHQISASFGKNKDDSTQKIVDLAEHSCSSQEFHDVHVVVNGSNFCNEVNSGESRNVALDFSAKISLPTETSPTDSIDLVRDRPSTSTLDTEVDLKRSSSGTATSGLPPVGPHGKQLLCDLQRNSMSSVDNERMKIESEVGRLRERLKFVQEGKENLNWSAERREREKMQLKLLEDIACQLQQIRQLTEPEKAVRQASLPLPSSKGMSKKRRSRSVSVGMQQSS